MATFPAPDSVFRTSAFVERDEHLRKKTGTARATILSTGDEWPAKLNAFSERPKVHSGILWIPADKKLGVGRLLGELGHPPDDNHSPGLLESQINKLTEEHKASMGGMIPTASTDLVKNEVHARVKLSIHQASKSTSPMIRLVLNLNHEDSQFFENKKKTYAVVELREKAVKQAQATNYNAEVPPPLDVILIENLHKRSDYTEIVVVNFEVAANQATGSIFSCDLDYKDFNPDVEAFRNRLVTGGKFSVILAGSKTIGKTIEEELAELKKDFYETARSPSLSRFLTNTSSNTKLGQHLIKKRESMHNHQAFSALETFPTLRDGLIMELGTLERQHSHDNKTQMDRPGLQLRIASMPASPGKHELLLFVQQPGGPALALNIGKKVRASIQDLNKKDRSDYDWHGKVVAHARRGSASDLVVLAEQQKEDESEEWAGADPSTLNVVDLTTQATPEEIAATVDRAQVYQVRLRTFADDHAYHVRTKNLTYLHEIVRGERKDPRAKWIEHLFTASRLDKLPIFNIFKGLGLSETIVEGFRAELDDEQKSVIDHMKSARGTVVVIEGPVGAGKTHITIRFAVAIVKDRKSKCPPEHSRPGARVLFVAPTNQKVEELMEQCDQACQEASEDAIVVRAFSVSTSQHIIQREGEECLKANCIPHGDHEAALKMAKNMGAASQALFEDLLTRIRQDFAHDARVTLRGLDLSAAEWVLWACRPLDPRDATVPKARMAALLRLRAVIPEMLRLGFQAALHAFEFEARDGWLETSSQSLFDATAAIWPYLYEAADVVIATPVLAMSKGVTDYLPAEVIVIDEATSLISADGLTFVRYPQCKCVIMTGDPKQPSAELLAGPEIDEFHAQGEIPFMNRLLAAGFPVAKLRTQRQYVKQLADLLNKLFYKHMIIRTHGNVPPPTTLAKVFPGLLHGAALAMLNVPDTKEDKIAGTESIVNLKIAAATWDHVKKALEGGVAERVITILTPYKGQAMIHVSIAKEFARANGKLRSEVSILTYEEARGKQNELVIMEIPNVGGPGFLTKTSRVLSAASRAKNGLIVVADAAAIDKWKGKETPISKFVKEMMATKVFPHIINDVTQHWTHAAMPVFTTR